MTIVLRCCLALCLLLSPVLHGCGAGPDDRAGDADAGQERLVDRLRQETDSDRLDAAGRTCRLLLALEPDQALRERRLFAVGAYAEACFQAGKAGEQVCLDAYEEALRLMVSAFPEGSGDPHAGYAGPEAGPGWVSDLVAGHLASAYASSAANGAPYRLHEATLRSGASLKTLQAIDLTLIRSFSAYGSPAGAEDLYAALLEPEAFPQDTPKDDLLQARLRAAHDLARAYPAKSRAAAKAVYLASAGLPGVQDFPELAAGLRSRIAGSLGIRALHTAGLEEAMFFARDMAAFPRTPAVLEQRARLHLEILRWLLDTNRPEEASRIPDELAALTVPGSCSVNADTWLILALDRLYYYRARHGSPEAARDVFDRLSALDAPGKAETLARVGGDLFEATQDPSIIETVLAAHAKAPEAEAKDMRTVLRLSALLRTALRPEEAVALWQESSPRLSREYELTELFFECQKLITELETVNAERANRANRALAADTAASAPGPGPGPAPGVTSGGTAVPDGPAGIHEALRSLHAYVTYALAALDVQAELDIREAQRDYERFRSVGGRAPMAILESLAEERKTLRQKAEEARRALLPSFFYAFLRTGSLADAEAMLAAIVHGGEQQGFSRPGQQPLSLATRLVRAWCEAGRPKAARRVFELMAGSAEADLSNPELADLAASLTAALGEAGTQEGTDYFRRQLEPEAQTGSKAMDEQSRFKLADALMRNYGKTGSLEQAHDLFKAFGARDVSGDNAAYQASMRIQYLLALVRHDRLDEARATLLPFLPTLPRSLVHDSVTLVHAMIMGYAGEGRLGDARSFFDEYLASYPPKDAVAVSASSLLSAYCSAGMLREARDVFDRYLALSGDGPQQELQRMNGAIKLQNAYAENESIPASLAFYRHALALAPHDGPDLTRFMIAILADSGDTAQAEALWLGMDRFGSDLHPARERAIAAVSIIRAHMKAGNRDKAFLLFDAMAHLGRSTEVRQQRDLARRLLEVGE